MIEIQTDHTGEDAPVFICDICSEAVAFSDFLRRCASVSWSKEMVDVCERCDTNIQYFIQAEMTEEDAAEAAAECDGYASDNDGLNGAMALISMYTRQIRTVKEHACKIAWSVKSIAKAVDIDQFPLNNEDFEQIKINDDIPF